MEKNLRPEPGTYIVILKVETVQKIKIGKIGESTFKKGYYIYIGSAHGPGGIKARIKRHLRKDKAKHWHIDYLRNIASLVAALIIYDKKKKECIWASKLYSSNIITMPINKFGSSDCSCKSHLFYSKKRLNIEMLKNILKESVDYVEIK